MQLLLFALQNDAIQGPAANEAEKLASPDVNAQSQQPEQQQELEEEDNYEDIDHELTPEPEHSAGLVPSVAEPVTAPEPTAALEAAAAESSGTRSPSTSARPSSAADQEDKSLQNDLPGDAVPQTAAEAVAAAVEPPAAVLADTKPAATAGSEPAAVAAGGTKAAAETHAPAAPVSPPKHVAPAVKYTQAAREEEPHQDGSSNHFQVSPATLLLSLSSNLYLPTTTCKGTAIIHEAATLDRQSEQARMSNCLQDEASMQATGTQKAPHKETAFERLTMPTSLRLLKMLEQTQVGAQGCITITFHHMP